MSIRCGCRCTCSWNRRASAYAAIAPSGMFTKKIQRQLAKSTNRPPRAGPTTAEMAQTLAT